MDEIWLGSVEFPTYEISNKGRVRNKDTDRIMRLYSNASGIVMVGLYKDGVKYTRSVSRLVAMAFVVNPHVLEFDTPIQLDGDQNNCSADNLKWRPRWFAWKYVQNFKLPTKMISASITDQHGRKYDTILSAACEHGLLCIDIRSGLWQGSPVYPEWLIFTLK